MKRRIQDFALEQEYTPHSSVRQEKPVRATDTQVIAFLLHRRESGFTRDPFYPAILQGLEQEAAERGYHVVVRSTTDTEEVQISHLPLFREHMADAAIVAGPDINRLMIMDLDRLHIPVVLVDNCIDEIKVDSVETDNVSGACIATQHLVSTRTLLQNELVIRHSCGCTA